MDYYHSWPCKISRKDTPFVLSTVGIDFLSGCYYIDNKLAGSINGSTLELKEESGLRFFIFTSSLNDDIYRIQLGKEEEYDELLASRDLFMQSYWIPEKKENKGHSSKIRNAYHSHYELKTTKTIPYSNFTIFKTIDMMYIVAQKDPEDEYHILKIRRVHVKDYAGCLDDHIREDERSYSLASLRETITVINNAYKDTGGLVRVASAKAILGFVRFTSYYYLVIATELKPEGMVMGHVIYSIASYDTISLYSPPEKKKTLRDCFKSNDSETEEKYIGLFNMVDLTKGFYLSYSYPLTHTVQHNILTCANNIPPEPQEMFVWNSYLLEEFKDIVSPHWYCHLVHGVFLQQRCLQYGQSFLLTLLARRSRMYAGPRYLKRGLNDDGYVANEVEVETIIEDEYGHICSHVQLRGSIPAYWKQDVSVAVPRPPIQIVKSDPYYKTFTKHIELLLNRYSAPIQVFDLVKQKEKHPRESIVSKRLSESCSFLNSQLPSGMKIRYNHIDFADIAKKSSEENPILHYILLNHSKRSLDETSFFANYIAPEAHRYAQNEQAVDEDSASAEKPLLKGMTNAFRNSLLESEHLEQRGVMRSNCIDCLDRTNVAQVNQ